MSFLDKVTKAVGDVVDKGKKDVDQFMKIQKINGEISAIERKIAGFKEQIKQVKAEAGGKAIDMLRAGTLTSPELQTYFDQVAGFEQQVTAEEAGIAAKKADIERIKAEHEAEHAAAVQPPSAPAQAVATAAPQPPAPPPVAPPPLPPAEAPAAPAAAAGPKFCGECGAQLGGRTSCPQCGAKVG